VSGDGFGRDDWPDDHPAGHDEGGPLEPATHDQYPAGGEGPDPDLGAIDYDLADDYESPAGLDHPSVEDGPDFGAPDEPDAAGPHFDPADADNFHADDDTSSAAGTPASPGYDDHWAAAIGYGAADPGGTQPGLFAHLDLSSAGSALDVEPEWLTEDLAGARATWVDPSLFDAYGARESASLVPVSAAEAVAGLWARLAPDTSMPADLNDALDALAIRAGATPLRPVVEAARRLLDE
jgi:hypothetical protein